MEQIRHINERDKVYVPFHYLLFFHKDKDMLMSQAEGMVRTMSSDDMECRILSEKELVVFLKYNYTLNFDERGLSSEQGAVYGLDSPQGNPLYQQDGSV